MVSLVAMILAICICSRLSRNFEIKWKPFVTLNYFNRPTITVKYIVAVILSQGLMYKIQIIFSVNWIIWHRRGLLDETVADSLLGRRVVSGRFRLSQRVQFGAHFVPDSSVPALLAPLGSRSVQSESNIHFGGQGIRR
jgi:hypothetical protein